MPTNLNALIRYKQIDACLKNKYIKCNIKRLQEACTEALGEYRGRYKLVSERTIHDDIRVLRSNALGFNAPISVDHGVYYYQNTDYSIFNASITEIELLKEILSLLISKRKLFNDDEINSLVSRISLITGEAQLQDRNESKPNGSLLMEPGSLYRENKNKTLELLPEKSIDWKTVYDIIG